MLISKFSKYINMALMFVLIIEYILLTCTVDLYPLLLCGFICGVFVIVNNRGKSDNDSSVTIRQGGTLNIVSYIILTFIVFVIAFIYVIRGLPIIWGSFSYLLDTSRIFRFVIYGLIYPVVSTLFITYSVTDTNPFEQLMINVFIVVLFITLFLGIIICMNWEWYINLASYLVNIF